MNERIKELLSQAGLDPVGIERMGVMPHTEKFAELIVQECVDTLLWHGCDDAVPYIKWMAQNKLGVK